MLTLPRITKKGKYHMAHHAAHITIGIPKENAQDWCPIHYIFQIDVKMPKPHGQAMWSLVPLNSAQKMRYKSCHLYMTT